MLRYLTYLVACSFIVMFAGCDTNKNDADNNKVTVTGMVTVESKDALNGTLQTLEEALEANENIGIVATIDHSSNAQNAGLSLRATQVILFGNPNLGTPLMQSSQTTAIDLPQKFLVYEDAEGQVFIAYNDPFYLAERHKLEGTQEQLDQIAGALQKLSEEAASESM